MHLVYVSTIAVSLCMLVAPALNAQGDASRVVAGGGISVPQWTGKIDAGEERAGRNLNDAKLTKDGDTFHVTTGPAVAYWSPANKAMGDYTVKATFTEPKYMNLNSHPHPYGIFIGGNEMGSANQSYLYCAAYGNGRFIVRGFGPGPFQMNGFQGEANAAVHQAAGVGQPVTQEIALVREGRPRGVLDQRNCRCGLQQDCVGRGRKAQVHGWHLWPSLRPQHGSQRYGIQCVEKLTRTRALAARQCRRQNVGQQSAS